MENKTPKQYTDNLIDEFFNAIPEEGFKGKYSTFRELAKKCAIICVQRTIDQVPMYFGELNPKWEYLDEVRSELIKQQPISL